MAYPVAVTVVVFQLDNDKAVSGQIFSAKMFSFGSYKKLGM
jgi:hypothetical protein